MTDITNESSQPFAVAYRPTEADANINGAVHGGVLFYLCDEAIARYVTSLGRAGAAANADIHFYYPARVGAKLTATVSERKTGRRLGAYLVEVKDAQGKLLADALFTVAFSEKEGEKR